MLENNFSLSAEKNDTENGLTERIKNVFEKHWSKDIPLIHFTNDLTNYGPGTKIVSTGFVSSIKNQGFDKFSNMGFVPPENMLPQIKDRFKDKAFADLNIITQEDAKSSPLKFLEAINRIRKEFVHHGLRTNKNKVSGRVSIPAVFIVDNTTSKQAGDDRPIHTQINKKIAPEKIIGVFRFDPQDMISLYMENKKNQTRKNFNEKIMFNQELSGNDKKIRNDFLKKFLRELGAFRLKELSALYSCATNSDDKIKIALSAHDLVDIYIVSPDSYDETFNDLSQTTKNIILNRRKKFSLLNRHKPAI